MPPRLSFDSTLQPRPFQSDRQPGLPEGSFTGTTFLGWTCQRWEGFRVGHTPFRIDLRSEQTAHDPSFRSPLLGKDTQPPSCLLGLKAALAYEGTTLRSPNTLTHSRCEAASGMSFSLRSAFRVSSESPEIADHAETSINTGSGRNITFCIGK